VSDGLEAATVAVIGFGNQGEAQAHRLRLSGLDVVVGARPGGPSEGRARIQGFPTLPIDEAARRATVAVVLLPDEVIPSAWPTLSEALKPDARVVFAHGFTLLYASLTFSAQADVVLVAPTAPGHVLKREGERLPAYIAVHQDGTGRAWGLAEAYAARIGLGPLWRTTVREETEVDLFGEQAVLCGGMNALAVAAFETLVARGYAPEIAYLECVHQIKYLADLLHDRGLHGFRRAISGTALYGDLTRGPRVIGEASLTEMKNLLEEIRSGAFAREWLGEVARGRPNLERAIRAAAAHPIEDARRRSLGESGGS